MFRASHFLLKKVNVWFAVVVKSNVYAAKTESQMEKEVHTRKTTLCNNDYVTQEITRATRMFVKREGEDVCLWSDVVRERVSSHWYCSVVLEKLFRQ